jgi:site-specific DNA-methyltransferase (adenine-specific)
MKFLNDESVDLILCDLPYGTTQCKWDVILPFDKLWLEYNRIIKPQGAIVLFGTEPFSSHLRLSNLKMYKYDWLWAKNDATDAMNAKNKPMRKIEKISVFSKGTTANGSNNKMNYFPQGLVASNIKRQGNDYGATGGSFKQFRPSHRPYVQELTGYPNDLLHFSKDKEKLHPTQKPVALIEYLIKSYTNENDMVLDNTMGAGTTGIACQNTNRKFTGIEKDKKYFNIAQNRILNNANLIYCNGSQNGL